MDRVEDCLLALADPGVSNSLSGDEKVLEALMEVSSFLTALSAKCSDSVRELCLEATTTQVALQNSMTCMSLLANTKFIESVSIFFVLMCLSHLANPFFFLTSIFDPHNFAARVGGGFYCE